MVAIAYVLSGSRAAAEDIAQEAFLRAHRDWGRVGAMEAPAAWVRKVALNLARSRLRRMRSEAAARLKLAPARLTDLPEDPLHDAFWAEVRNLPRRQHQVKALYYLEDLSIAEIAAVLEVAEGTVKASLNQGRTWLRRQLTAKGWLT